MFCEQTDMINNKHKRCYLKKTVLFLGFSVLICCTETVKLHPPVAVQGDDVERERGDVHGEALSERQQEAEGAAELPLPLQRVDQGEGQAERVDQQVGCSRTRRQTDRFVTVRTTKTQNSGVDPQGENRTLNMKMNQRNDPSCDSRNWNLQKLNCPEAAERFHASG